MKKKIFKVIILHCIGFNDYVVIAKVTLFCNDDCEMKKKNNNIIPRKNGDKQYFLTF